MMRIFTLMVVALLVPSLTMVPAIAGPACCQPKTSTATEAQASSDKDLEAVLAFVRQWAPTGLRMMKVGGYIKLGNPSGEFHTATTLSEATGIQLTDADMDRVLAALMAEADAQGQTHTATCAAPAAAECSELTLTTDVDACLVDAIEVSAERAKVVFAKAKTGDGAVYQDRRLPKFQMQDLDGKRVPFTTLNGAPAVVAVLSADCGHSMRTFSTLQRVQKRYPDLKIVAVFDAPESADALRKKLESRTVRTPVRVSADAAQMCDVQAVPTLLFVDARGQIREQWVGEKMEKVLVESLGEWLDSDRLGLRQE